jgi:hypothetical protein
MTLRCAKLSDRNRGEQYFAVTKMKAMGAIDTQNEMLNIEKCQGREPSENSFKTHGSVFIQAPS